MTRAVVLLSLSGLLRAWKQSLATVAFIALTLTMTLSVIGYNRGLAEEYTEAGPAYLVVQEVGSYGEIGTSRLSLGVAEELAERGISQIIPQISKAVGTSMEDVVQIRGVRLGDYPAVTPYELLEGEALTPSSPSRDAMAGWRLAEQLDLLVGGPVRLRGRDFRVIGVFRTGTYADNQVWISLSDAQTLVGYGEDVSVFLVPDEGKVRVGEVLPGNAEVVRRGESLRMTLAEFAPIIDFFDAVTGMVSLTCGVTLAVVLLRLAWLQRRELAVLRCLGYTIPRLVGYLLAQAASLTLAGCLLGGVGLWALATVAPMDLAGLVIPLRIDPATLLAGLGWLVAIILAGTAVPAAWLSRVEPDSLLRVE